MTGSSYLHGRKIRPLELLESRTTWQKLGISPTSKTLMSSDGRFIITQSKREYVLRWADTRLEISRHATVAAAKAAAAN